MDNIVMNTERLILEWMESLIILYRVMIRENIVVRLQTVLERSLHLGQKYLTLLEFLYNMLLGIHCA